MATLHLYDKLLQFPLFQGMSHADLMEVVAHTRIGFHKYPEGKTLWRANSPCHQLVFLINGTLLSERSAPAKLGKTTERLSAPYLLEPERLYGIGQTFQHTYTTLTDCNALTIDKTEVRMLMERHLVFRLNFINLLSTICQRYDFRIWQPMSTTLRERIIRFFFSQCQHPAGHKTYHVLTRHLALRFNANVKQISQVLHQLEADGLVTLHRGRIEVPMIERLLM